MPDNGTLLIPSDRNATAYLLDQAGTTLDTVVMSRCEIGDILPNGVVALGRTVGFLTTHLDLYDAALALTASVALADMFGQSAHYFSPIRGNHRDRFYVACSDDSVAYPNVRVRAVLQDGTLVDDTWTLPYPVTDDPGLYGFNRVRSMTPNASNTRLFYTWSDPPNSYHSPIFVHDLVNDVSLGALVPADALYTGTDLYWLETGDLLQLYGWAEDGDVETAIKRFSSEGEALQTYALPDGAQDESPAFMGVNWADPSTVWVRTFEYTPPTSVMTFRQMDLASGETVTSFTVPYPTGTPPDLVGVPKSCPLLVYSVSADPDVCVTAPTSVGCWTGNMAGGIGCATGVSRSSAACWSGHDGTENAITLHGEGQP